MCILVICLVRLNRATTAGATPVRPCCCRNINHISKGKNKNVPVREKTLEAVDSKGWQSTEWCAAAAAAATSSAEQVSARIHTAVVHTSVCCCCPCVRSAHPHSTACVSDCVLCCKRSVHTPAPIPNRVHTPKVVQHQRHTP